MAAFNVFVGLATVGLMFLQWLAMLPPTPGGSTVMRPAQYWPLIAQVVLVILVWGPIAYRWASRKPCIWGQVMPTYTITKESYQAEISGESLREFKGKYNFVLASGNNDPAVDRFEDDKISLSSAYTIESQTIGVVVKWRRSWLVVCVLLARVYSLSLGW